MTPRVDVVRTTRQPSRDGVRTVKARHFKARFCNPNDSRPHARRRRRDAAANGVVEFKEFLCVERAVARTRCAVGDDARGGERGWGGCGFKREKINDDDVDGEARGRRGAERGRVARC